MIDFINERRIVMQEKRKYDTLVISNTYDLERLVMYPESVV